MTDLQGWQKVAREIGDYDMENAWGKILPEDLEPRTDDFVGHWLPAEAAAKEILRLREDSNTVALNEDVHKLLRELGISDHARPVSCHRVVNDEILPAIKRLRDRNAVLERVYEALATGFAMKTHDLSMNQSWVVDDVEEVREALAAAEQQQEARPPVNHDLLAERAPPPPADLVQATQNGEHPAIHAKGVEGMKAVRMPKGKETDR